MEGVRPALTRHAIVREAARLFAERGYDQAHMRDIARPLGVSHAALYHHFPDKLSILVRVVEFATDGLAAQLDGVLAIPCRPEERFGLALEGHIDFVASNVDVVRTLFESEAALPADARARLQQFRRRYRDDLRELARLAQQAGLGPSHDPSLIVHGLFGAANSVYRWYRPGGPLRPDGVASELAELLLLGWSLAPEAAASAPADAPLELM
jgi:TetR/AcrR family transcriptional regulator, cholesterol catabolism regulator